MPDPADTNLDEVRRRARRRLIGAIVLALAAAVVVPLLLESDPKPLGEDVSVRIPPIDSGKFVNRLSDAKGKPDPKSLPAPAPEAARSDAAREGAPRTPDAKTGADETGAPRKSLAEAEQRVLAPAAKGAARSEAAATPAKPEPAATPVKSAQDPKPVSASESRPDSRTTPAQEAKAAAPAESRMQATEAKPAAGSVPTAKDGAFSVQLAAYSDDKGANALANKLARSGHAAYVEPHETSRGTVWRVRVGPFPTREAAIAARDRLKSEGQNGIVTPSK